MARIKTIRINNFKFFGDAEPLEITDGKNLLVYGENGSGKSTIYWALYTLLESAAKTDATQIEKYFKRGNNELHSLVNIYAATDATGNFASFVEAELDNGSSYRISLTDTQLHQNQQAQLSNMVSDFMNYRLLSKIYDFSHSIEIDLYPLFEREVLPYIDFSNLELGLDAQGQMQYERRADRILNKLWEGPGYVLNHNQAQILPHKGSQEYKAYLDKIQRFNSDLNNLLGSINQKGNEILHNDFGYKNFDFHLSLKQGVAIDKKDKWFNRIYPKIAFEITSYNGVTGIHKPHSFLNEAKLSALALAIRLALLERNYDPNVELRLLVLDDLLLSLDMQNRDRVLELLLNKYVSRYQIFLLTHDYHFFEIAKSRIKLKGQKDQWLTWEMYAEENPHRPIIVKSNTYLEKAQKHIAEKDFAAAGNYLRKEAEKWVKGFLPRRQQLSKDLSEKDLNGMINQSIDFARLNNLSPNTQSLLEKLGEHRKFIFNPLSHDSYDMSRLRTDVQTAVKTLEALNKISSKIVCKIGDSLWFELISRDGNIHRFDIELCDELKIINEPTITPKLAHCPFFTRYGTNGGKMNGLQEHKDLEKFYNNKYNQSDKSANSDFTEGVFLSDGQPLRSKF
jgi:energy-coupling factor transporter ATP-binding protein EcfA2